MTIHPRLRLTRRGRLVVAVVTTATAAVGVWTVTVGADREPVASATVAPASTSTPMPSPSETTPAAPGLRRHEVPAGARWVAEGVAETVVAAVDGVLARAPVVVVAADDALTPARGVAWRLRAPLLPSTAPGLDELLERLGTTTVVEVATASRTDDRSSPTPSRSPSPGRVVVQVEGSRLDLSALQDVAVPAPPDGGPGVMVLVRPDDPAYPLLGALAQAAGASLVPVEGELARDADALVRLRAAPDVPWAVAGTAAGWRDLPAEVLAWDVDVARSGTELPGGGLRLFPGRRLVAMYGSPGAASLGVLGEQPVDAAVARARDLAAPYAAVVDEPVIPTFEIIVTVASGAAGARGDYSNRVPLDQVEPWVDAAEAAGMYVVLDLQPGRTDFLTQAKELAHLLRRPHVGLALDPEWRLAPDQVHLSQVGSVAVEEVQAVADWLAELTREARLPQKVLLLHQFTLSMIRDRAALRVPAELGVVIQMDGQGSQGAKDATWQAITTIDPPADVRFGWKNFYDEDTSLRSPQDTLAVEPSPVLVSYQ